jgi:hypothetical protein
MQFSSMQTFMMRSSTLAVAAIAISAQICHSAEPPVLTFRIPSVGGWAIDPAMETLIVSSPETGEIFLFDTVRVTDPVVFSVPFKPAEIALRGTDLYVNVQGSSLVHVVSLRTKRPHKRYVLPGTAVNKLAAHPTTGPVFASNLDEEVIAIDPTSGRVAKTSGRGMFLAVDQARGEFLYTGTNRPSQDVIEARQEQGGIVRFRLVTVSETAAVLKYRIGAEGLTLVGGNPNTAVGAGGSLHVSPDGSRVVMVAGGGWRSTENARVRHEIAVFDGDDVNVMLGGLKCGAPQSICYHPALKLGVAQGNSTDFFVFDSESLLHRDQYRVTGMGPITFWHNMLTFGGRGTRIVTLQGNYLHFIPLDLTRDERAVLTKRYGTLPNLFSVRTKQFAKRDGGSTPRTAARESPAEKVRPEMKTQPETKPHTEIKARPAVVEIPNSGRWRLASAKEGISYLADRPHRLSRISSEYNGASLVIRPAADARKWIGSNQITALRECTTYVSLLVEFNGQEAVPEETLKVLEKEGWKAESSEFQAAHVSGNENWVWQLLSRKVPRGPIDIPTEVVLQAPTQAIFFFSE